MSNLAFGFKMSENQKRALIVLAVFLIIFLLLAGLIYFIVNRFMKKESKKIDSYMFDLCSTKIVKNPVEFKAAVKYTEKRRFYSNLRWPFRIAIIFTIGLILTTVLTNHPLEELFTLAGTIFPSLKFTTIAEINEILVANGQPTIVGFAWMPVSFIPNIITATPDLTNMITYLSILFYFISFGCLFFITRACLRFIARIRRGSKMANEVFSKDLDKVNFVQNDMSQFLKDKIEPTSEIK